eukprot:UN21771
MNILHFSILFLFECLASSNLHSVTYYVKHEPQKIKDLTERFWRISTPGNPEYGHFLSRKELSTYLQPEKEAKKALISYLQSIEATFDDSTTPVTFHFFSLPHVVENQQ